jgi:HD-like signal output (HDOD) protein
MSTLTASPVPSELGVDALVRHIDRLVAFPEVWIRINRLIEAERSAGEIARSIEVDTDLSARLLRTVNSAFYGLASRVETISRAIAVIGTHDLRELTMLTVVRRLFTGIPVELMDIQRFWEGAVTTGVYAGLLGRVCHLLHVERVLVMGVLHNVGQLAICQYLPAQARETLYIAAGDHEVLALAEQELLGFDHQELGGALLRSWRLPESLCQAAAYHHCPERAECHELEVAIVHLAGLLQGCLALGLDSAAVLERAHPVALGLAPVSKATLEDIRERGELQIAELSQQFLGAPRNDRRPAP